MRNKINDFKKVLNKHALINLKKIQNNYTRDSKS